MTQLRAKLLSLGRLAIHGLGGVGKTQLVVQYVHRHRADYPEGTFWLRGDATTTLTSDLASLAWRLRLPERELTDQDLVIEAVTSWLRGHERWLLVIDNLDESVSDVVVRWLPPGLQGHVLVTSRLPMWQARLGLEPLSMEMAIRFLIMRTGQTDKIRHQH